MRSALLLLPALSSLVTAIPSSNFIPSNLRRDTAPAPEKTPPGTVHAIRDPSKLKFELIAIFGAYVVWLIATIFLILVAKRLRRKAFSASQEPSMTEMKNIIATAHVVELPSKSPGLKSPRSWGKKGHKSKVASEYSISSVTSVHSDAHEQQKARDMTDLTALYAAVMAHDEARSQGHNSAAQSPDLAGPRSPTSPGYPVEFAQMHNTVAMTQPPQNPNGRLHNPMAPTPIEETFPQDAQARYDSDITSRMDSRPPKSPMSFISDMSARAGSMISAKARPSRVSIRGHNISQPLGSARDRQYLEETVPLSPRVYQPGPAPSAPGNKKQAQVTFEATGGYEHEHEFDEYDEEEDERQYQRYHRYQQQQQQQQQQQEQPQPQPQPQTQPPTIRQPTQRRLPPQLALRSAAAANNFSSDPNSNDSINTNTNNKALPFRDMYGNPSVHSAPATKTTFLNRPTKLSSGPKTGSLIPSTPFTPYSPYTPMTPMTPITPRRLATKQELKQRKKEERRKVATQDDLVEADESAWGA